jgi:hypothetical protein
MRIWLIVSLAMLYPAASLGAELKQRALQPSTRAMGVGEQPGSHAPRGVDVSPGGDEAHLAAQLSKPLGAAVTVQARNLSAGRVARLSSVRRDQSSGHSLQSEHVRLQV